MVVLEAHSEQHLEELPTLSMETETATDGREERLPLTDDAPVQTKEYSPTPVAPPDGGWGWLVVLGSCLIHVISDGLIYSFGVFYIELLDEYGSTKGETSVVASLTVGVSFVVGPIASLCVDRYQCRVTAILGTIISAFGFFISTWSPNVYFLYMSYGLLTGFGFGFLLHPAIVAVGQYFDKRRSLATGIAICGSGLGTFLFPPLVQYLISLYAWQGASLILSAVILNCAVCGALFRPLTIPNNAEKTPPEIKENSTENIKESAIKNEDDANALLPSTQGNSPVGGRSEPHSSDRQRKEKQSLLHRLKQGLRNNSKLKLLKDPSLLLFALSGSLTSVGYNAPFLFLPHHAELHGLHGQQASFLISIIGITSIFGRVICGYLGDRIGEKRLYAFSAATIINGLCTALCPLCVNYTSLVLYAAGYGFSMGAYMAYNWVLLVDLMGLENLSASLGLVMMFDGLSAPIGPPLLGWVFDVTGSYNMSFIVGGVVIVLSGTVVFPIACIRHANRQNLKHILIENGDITSSNKPVTSSATGVTSTTTAV